MKIVYSSLSENPAFATNVAFGRKYAILRRFLYQADYQKFEPIRHQLTAPSYKKGLAFRRYSGGFSAILHCLFAETSVLFRRNSTAASSKMWIYIGE